MIRLNRTTEYGLIALRHMSRKVTADPLAPGLTNAREISESYGLPFEITAKTLQKLRDIGLLESAHGAKGGYTLAKSLSDVSLAEFLQQMEGPLSVVMCAGPMGGEDHSSECEYGTKCQIKGWVNGLNARIFNFLSGISLTDLAADLNESSAERDEGLIK